VDGGTIAQLGTSLDANEHRVVEGAGLVLAPAFVDPHVHLRTPGREDEESIASGTAAAAAGGYCAILAMPNTDPVVDSAAVLGSLIEDAQAEAEIPVGFLAAITRGQAGGELTGMAASEGQPRPLLHLSARESVEALSRAQAAGVVATGEVTPHHLCLTDDAVRTLDSNVKMNPPLRSADDRSALIGGLRDGTIGSVA